MLTERGNNGRGMGLEGEDAKASCRETEFNMTLDI
jgi:hypothetical protein